MNFDSLRQLGFEGFVTAATLRSSRCEDVPAQPGVYAVVRDAVTMPNFLSVNPAGHFKGRDPTISRDALQAKWVPETQLLYLGKAGGDLSAATLRRRINAYLRHGDGKPVGHWGGRAIWQLADAQDLRFAWQQSSEEPRTLERRLLSEFAEVHGKLPFANWKG